MAPNILKFISRAQRGEGLACTATWLTVVDGCNLFLVSMEGGFAENGFPAVGGEEAERSKLQKPIISLRILPVYTEEKCGNVQNCRGRSPNMNHDNAAWHETVNLQLSASVPSA